MISIAFIIPYFGRWPVWFPAFLVSCRGNPTIDWIFFTDCPVPDAHPENVIFHQSTIKAMQELASSKIGSPVRIDYPTKFCDLKPAYGHIFEEYLQRYDFWGFCDIDIIWGDIRAFITEDMLKSYDLISSRKETISGHFTILRNNAYNRFLYQSGGVFKELFEHPRYRWFDEVAFAGIVADQKNSGQLKVWWDEYLVNHERGRDSHQEYYIDRWLYDNGKLYDLGLNGNQKVEHMYLHFINWKTTIKSSVINSDKAEIKYYISYNRITENKSSSFLRKINQIKNDLWGYYRYERFELAKLKIKKRLSKLFSTF